MIVMIWLMGVWRQVAKRSCAAASCLSCAATRGAARVLLSTGADASVWSGVLVSTHAARCPVALLHPRLHRACLWQWQQDRSVRCFKLHGEICPPRPGACAYQLPWGAQQCCVGRGAFDHLLLQVASYHMVHMTSTNLGERHDSPTHCAALPAPMAMLVEMCQLSGH